MPTYHGSCHCQAVRFEVDTTIDRVTVCNCSICSKKGIVHHRVAPESVRLISGQDVLATYQFNTRVARHWFCRTCGIYPFHQTRKDRGLWRANVGCLHGVDPYALESSISDGASLGVVNDA